METEMYRRFPPVAVHEGTPRIPRALMVLAKRMLKGEEPGEMVLDQPCGAF
jgi:hypothetical protein